MAVIQEKLVLLDQFSGTFSKYLNMGRSAAGVLEAARAGQASFSAAARAGGAAMDEMAASGQELADAMDRARQHTEKSGDAAGNASNKQDRHNRSMRSGASAAESLTRKLTALAAGYLSLQGAQKLVGLSDAWTQTTARLDRMNDGRQTTPEIQDMIYQAAQRSRGDYQDTADMVAKLGTLAGDAFGSTAEVVAFAEQINKQFALAGASAQGAQAAMLQLTQAMSSGVLRGEELNSVLEQAPTITKSIADYLGVNIGQLREMASEGAVTADVVKAAMFHAAEETDRAFEAVPLTFSQAWTMAKNAALDGLRPALGRLSEFLGGDVGQSILNGLVGAAQRLGDVLLWVLDLAEAGVQWAMENGDLLVALAVALGAVMAGSAAASAAAWAAANWPMLLIVGAIALIIYMALQMGAAWEDVGGFVGGVLYELYAVAYNLTADAWNLIATFAEFLANVFNNPAAAIANLLADLADWALSVIQSIASGIDAVFGSNLSGAVGGWRSSLKGWVHDAFGENEIKIQRMEKIDYGDAWDRGSQMGRGAGAWLEGLGANDYLSKLGGTSFDYANMLSSSGIPGALEGIGGDTKAIRSSVALSEEDVRLLVDQAEREYVSNVNLTAQTPVITINGQNTGNFEEDLAWLENALVKILSEQSASHTDLSYR